MLLKPKLQAGADAGWRSDCGSGKQAGEIQHIHLVREVVSLDFKRNVSSLFMVERGTGAGIQRKIRTHAARLEIHTTHDRGAVLRHITIDVTRRRQISEVRWQAAPVFR